MKLKCNDGAIRSFSVAHCDGDFISKGVYFEGFIDAFCEKCGYNFGCHSTVVLKPEFKKHICKNFTGGSKYEDKNGS